MLRRTLLASLALVAAFACTTTQEIHVPVYSDAGTAEPVADASKPVGKADAAKNDDDDDDDDPKDAATGLEPTQKTSAVVTIDNVKRTLQRAQYGVNGNGTLRIEAHEGGDPACPDESSPSPKRTLIISGVKVGKAGDKQTKAEGVSATFLDFAKDQLPDDVPFTKATAVSLEIVLIKAGGVELEIEAAFDEGTASGRVFAEHCESLDE